MKVRVVVAVVAVLGTASGGMAALLERAVPIGTDCVSAPLRPARYVAEAAAEPALAQPAPCALRPGDRLVYVAEAKTDGTLLGEMPSYVQQHDTQALGADGGEGVEFAAIASAAEPTGAADVPAVGALAGGDEAVAADVGRGFAAMAGMAPTGAAGVPTVTALVGQGDQVGTDVGVAFAAMAASEPTSDAGVPVVVALAERAAGTGSDDAPVFKVLSHTALASIDALLPPVDLWSEGPLGELRRQANAAAAAGDRRRFEAIAAEYWLQMEAAMARRTVFEAREGANTRRGRGRQP